MQTFTGGLGDFQCLAFSPGAGAIASGSSDGTLELWSVATGQVTATLAGQTDSVNTVAFSPDDQTLASGGGGIDDTVRLWALPY